MQYILATILIIGVIFFCHGLYRLIDGKRAGYHKFIIVGLITIVVSNYTLSMFFAYISYSTNHRQAVTIHIKKIAQNKYKVIVNNPEQYSTTHIIDGKTLSITGYIFKWHPLLAEFGAQPMYRIEDIEYKQNHKTISSNLTEFPGFDRLDLLNDGKWHKLQSITVPVVDGASYQVQITKKYHIPVPHGNTYSMQEVKQHLYLKPLNARSKKLLPPPYPNIDKLLDKYAIKSIEIHYLKDTPELRQMFKDANSGKEIQVYKE